MYKWLGFYSSWNIHRLNKTVEDSTAWAVCCLINIHMVVQFTTKLISLTLWWTNQEDVLLKI